MPKKNEHHVGLGSGNGDQYAMTLVDVAKRIGLSRARTWQLEQRALGKLRKAILADDELVELAGIKRRQG